MSAALRSTMRPHTRQAGRDSLIVWAERSGHRRVTKQGPAGLRFTFYGRVSTEDHQDPVTSRARQWDQAAALVAGFGWIVAEFFDVEWSRVLPWARRPQAAALLAALADPDRPFDAIVIGAYEQAFHGSQYALMAPLFEHYGARVTFRCAQKRTLMYKYRVRGVIQPKFQCVLAGEFAVGRRS